MALLAACGTAAGNLQSMEQEGQINEALTTGTKLSVSARLTGTAAAGDPNQQFFTVALVNTKSKKQLGGSRTATAKTPVEWSAMVVPGNSYALVYVSQTVSRGADGNTQVVVDPAGPQAIPFIATRLPVEKSANAKTPALVGKTVHLSIGTDKAVKGAAYASYVMTNGLSGLVIKKGWYLAKGGGPIVTSMLVNAFTGRVVGPATLESLPTGLRTYPIKRWDKGVAAERTYMVLSTRMGRGDFGPPTMTLAQCKEAMKGFTFNARYSLPGGTQTIKDETSFVDKAAKTVVVAEDSISEKVSAQVKARYCPQFIAAVAAAAATYGK